MKIYHGNLQPEPQVGFRPGPQSQSGLQGQSRLPGKQTLAVSPGPGGRSTAALSHRLITARLVLHGSGTHPLVKTCPASGPIGGDLAWAGSDVLAEVYGVTANIIHNILACECRQGISATRLVLRVPALNTQTETRDTDFPIQHCHFYLNSVRPCDLSTLASSSTILISCVGFPQSRRSTALSPRGPAASPPTRCCGQNPDKLSCSTCGRCSVAAALWSIFSCYFCVGCVCVRERESVHRLSLHFYVGECGTSSVDLAAAPLVPHRLLDLCTERQ